MSHGVEPFDVVGGALVNADSLPYVREGVHIAVVDPGVGTERRALAVEDASGRIHVGPDNGLLMPAIERFGGGRDAVALSVDPHLASATFHGRDVFAPAAARIAAGAELGELGETVGVGSLTVLPSIDAEVGAGRLESAAVLVDWFGNVALHTGPGALEEAGLRAGDTVLVIAADRETRARVGDTFSSVPSGEPLVYQDSFGRVAIAVREASATRTLALRRGERVTIQRTT